jgi:hypothetical protein
MTEAGGHVEVATVPPDKSDGTPLSVARDTVASVEEGYK